MLIVASAWGVLRDSTAILMEETPSGIDADEVARAIVEVRGVTSVHDLHVWRITSGFDALSAHVLVGRARTAMRGVATSSRCSRRRFGITHTTLQVDHDAADALIELRRVSCRVTAFLPAAGRRPPWLLGRLAVRGAPPAAASACLRLGGPTSTIAFCAS